MFILLLIGFWQNFQDFLSPLLQGLDPALFQNIILGILAIFIPFAIVFLTNVLNAKKEKRSEFEKMALSDEVLGTKKVFWLAIFGIVFFAFFSGVDTSTPVKIAAIVAVIILVYLFWQPFKKILRFAEGHKTEFEISFLKNLGFSKIFKFRNKVKAEKMVRAWSSFWSEKSEFNERDFTKIFISHIDDAITFEKIDFAVQLAQFYANNIEKRDRLSIDEILPKVFEWNEILQDKQQLWQKEYDAGVWRYFGGDFFQAIIKKLLKDEDYPYKLFSSFKEHIEASEKKLEKITDEKEKKNYRRYINGLFSSFFTTFFNEINSAPSKYEIWEEKDYFPPEWKITIANKDNRIARVILGEFLDWSSNRIFKQAKEGNIDEDLTEVINGIFPNVHSPLFKAFLMLFYSSEVKYAIEKEPNFYILDVTMSSGFVGESKADRDKRLAEMKKAKDVSQKEETIQIILEFFHFWKALKIYKHNLSEGESKNWESYAEEERQLIVKRVRKEKLGKIKKEIESEEIKNICANSENKEFYRKDFLELIELLIEEIEK